ncbi:hypothetical protein ACH5RR_016739 [Cinchona calisaya]|uniref:Uncharacterized protein n=1 Tax=Cinchona calisaya TaxID=153742 RepID=A0ABD3A079_9GENT
MNTKIGHDFEIPPTTINILTAVGIIIVCTIYDEVLVPTLRKLTGNERALVERKRLRTAYKEIIEGKTVDRVPMSVFWLAPQFTLLGIGEAFTLVGLQEYFYDRVPDSMRSLDIFFYISTTRVGNFLSSFSDIYSGLRY